MEPRLVIRRDNIETFKGIRIEHTHNDVLGRAFEWFVQHTILAFYQ